MSFTVKWDTDGLMKKIRDAANDELAECAMDALHRSQKLCPKERGFNGGLVSSAIVEVDPEALTARIRYKMPHAWLQHEKTNYKHKNGEQAKYLEQVIDQFGAAYISRIGSAIKKKLRK